MFSADPTVNNAADALEALARDISSHKEEVVSVITLFVEASGMVHQMHWLKPNQDPIEFLLFALERLDIWVEDTVLNSLGPTPPEEIKRDLMDHLLERIKGLLERSDALGMNRSELLNALRDPGEEMTGAMVH